LTANGSGRDERGVTDQVSYTDHKSKQIAKVASINRLVVIRLSILSTASMFIFLPLLADTNPVTLERIGTPFDATNRRCAWEAMD
jgi:hypothetical protein